MLLFDCYELADMNVVLSTVLLFEATKLVVPAGTAKFTAYITTCSTNPGLNVIKLSIYLISLITGKAK